MTFDLGFEPTLPAEADEHADRAPTAEEYVRHVLAAHLECSPTRLHPDQHLERDLGFTRLGLVLVSLDLEDITHVALPFEGLEQVHTVAELGRYLGAALRQGKRGAERGPRCVTGR
jgi:acyl carrier protein